MIYLLIRTFHKNQITSPFFPVVAFIICERLLSYGVCIGHVLDLGGRGSSMNRVSPFPHQNLLFALFIVKIIPSDFSRNPPTGLFKSIS